MKIFYITILLTHSLTALQQLQHEQEGSIEVTQIQDLLTKPHTLESGTPIVCRFADVYKIMDDNFNRLPHTQPMDYLGPLTFTRKIMLEREDDRCCGYRSKVAHVVMQASITITPRRQMEPTITCDMNAVQFDRTKKLTAWGCVVRIAGLTTGLSIIALVLASGLGVSL